MRSASSGRGLLFIEAPAFSRYREEYLTDEDLRALQLSLVARPEAGPVIPGTGGIRKLRWQDKSRTKGKRGGLRIIYYCFLEEDEIWLLTLYNKDEATDLTPPQRLQLKKALEAECAARRTRPKP